MNIFNNELNKKMKPQRRLGKLKPGWILSCLLKGLCMYCTKGKTELKMLEDIKLKERLELKFV